MADDITAFARSFFFHEPAKNIVIVGAPGCGKTHTAKRLHRWALKNAQGAFDTGEWDDKGHFPDSLFCSWPEITEGYYRGEFSVTADLIETDLLFIDDIGAERDTASLASDKLCQILSRREKRYTLITTNVQPEQWSERWRDDRIPDRLLRNTIVIDLTAVPSYSVL